MKKTDLTSPISFKDYFLSHTLIGEGGGGQVYRVEDKTHGVVALKVLSNTDAFDENTVLRFLQEIDVASKVKHPNLIRAIEGFNFKEGFAFTMEYVKGKPLSKCIQNSYPVEVIDRIMRELLSALDALHALNVVHGDMKLENIMLDENENVKLGDFGLAKNLEDVRLTRPNMLVGTPQYMSPEYITYREYDKQSDIYACGVILFELLSQKRYLANHSNLQGGQLIDHLEKTLFAFPDLKLSKERSKYVRILTGALAYDRKHRFKSAIEMQLAFDPIPTDNMLDQSRTSVIFTEDRKSVTTNRTLDSFLRIAPVVTIILTMLCVLMLALPRLK